MASKHKMLFKFSKENMLSHEEKKEGRGVGVLKRKRRPYPTDSLSLLGEQVQDDHELVGLRT